MPIGWWVAIITAAGTDSLTQSAPVRAKHGLALWSRHNAVQVLRLHHLVEMLLRRYAAAVRATPSGLRVVLRTNTAECTLGYTCDVAGNSQEGGGGGRGQQQ